METLFTRDGTPKAPTHHDAKGNPLAQVEYSCTRCGGLGGSDRWRHTGWTCYKCGGNGHGGYRSVKLYTAKKLEKLNAALAKRRAKKAEEAAAALAKREAEAETARAAFNAAHPDVLEWLETGTGDFCHDLGNRYQRLGTLTDKQVEAVRKIIKQNKAREELHAASSHAGEVKERLRGLAVTVEFVTGYWRAAPYALKGEEYVYVVTMVDAQGNAFVVKSPNFCKTSGSALVIDATVKAHTEYKGRKQTQLQRVTVKECTQPAEMEGH